jgi:hypothetical protein
VGSVILVSLIRANGDALAIVHSWTKALSATTTHNEGKDNVPDCDGGAYLRTTPFRRCWYCSRPELELIPMEPTTYKHMDNVECPHCAGHQLALVAYAFDNGSAKWSEFRCAECSTHWRVNRQYKLSEIFFIGKTAEEIRCEIRQFAAMQSAMSELHLHNADEGAFRMLAH